MRDALSVTSMGQASATLSAATSQHLTAVLGGHSLTEAVLLGALTLLGLIGTEHCMTPPFSKIGSRWGRTDPPHILDSARSGDRHRSTLFHAPSKTARLILYTILLFLSTKILSFFSPFFFGKPIVFPPGRTQNLVVFFFFESQDMVCPGSLFFILYIRICVDFSTVLWYTELNYSGILLTEEKRKITR